MYVRTTIAAETETVVQSSERAREAMKQCNKVIQEPPPHHQLPTNRPCDRPSANGNTITANNRAKIAIRARAQSTSTPATAATTATTTAVAATRHAEGIAR